MSNPQMYPMSWMLIYLYIIENFLFLLWNFFTKSLTMKQKMNKIKLINENSWKW